MARVFVTHDTKFGEKKIENMVTDTQLTPDTIWMAI
jgi:hypothetical protein